ncbi:MAG: 2-oxoacid:ferredoxin oxidoreductase subunit beta [Halanaerobium sp.]
MDFEKYLRKDKLPHIWCPGCGHGTILNSFIRAFAESNFDQDKTVVISGIGCSGRATGYLNFDTLHTTHGRAIAFATGVKMANPDLNVIVMTGDGDGSAIGGNHLIHAARRNIDLTVILFNNQIYGMTGGQFSPMTPTGDLASTAPYGNIDQNFDLAKLVEGAGGTFIARGATYEPRQLKKLYLAALKHRGFSFVESFSQCPVSYGRQNKAGDAVEMLKKQQQDTMAFKEWQKLSEREQNKKYPLGILKEVNNPESEYTARYQKIIEKIKKEGAL